MKSTTRAFVFAFSLGLSGCALSPPTTTGNFVSNMDEASAMNLIYELATECWARDYSFWKGDALVVEGDLADIRGRVVTVRRSAPDIGYQEPFMLVFIRPGDSGSQIEAQEGPCAYDCNMNFTSDLDRWLSGDTTCAEN